MEVPPRSAEVGCLGQPSACENLLPVNVFHSIKVISVLQNVPGVIYSKDFDLTLGKLLVLLKK